MKISSRRALARLVWTFSVSLPAAAAPAPGDAPLALAEAQGLAVTRQPLLEAQEAAVRAARERAVADRQLPDPTLVAGVADVPAGGPDRFSLSGDPDTQVMVGVRQSFPGGRERALRGARGTAEAERMAAELDEQRRRVRRETALAWLEAWKMQRAQELLDDSIVEAEREQAAVDIAYRAGRATQADLLAARVGVEVLHDERAGLEQDEWHARNMLRRWIGDAAERPLSPSLPPGRAPDTAALLAELDRHPHLAAHAAAVSMARTDVELARADYRPDWSVELGYGYRTDLEDMASLQLEIGLPVFRGRRQDRVVASRSAALAQAESLREDWLRQHRADIRLNVDDWQRLQQRFRRYDDAILPQARQRLEAALAAYGAGSGTLVAVIEARRHLLELRMQRLELEYDAARHQAQLEYFVLHGESS